MSRSNHIAKAPAELLADPLAREIIVSLASESATQYQIADALGVSRSTVARALAADPELKSQYEATLYEASSQELERIKTIPFNDELDPHRARIQIDALARYLELRWPDRYGKRVNVAVKFADLRGALGEARARVEARKAEESALQVAAALQHDGDGDVVDAEYSEIAPLGEQ